MESVVGDRTSHRQPSNALGLLRRWLGQKFGTSYYGSGGTAVLLEQTPLQLAPAAHVLRTTARQTKLKRGDRRIRVRQDQELAGRNRVRREKTSRQQDLLVICPAHRSQCQQRIRGSRSHPQLARRVEDPRPIRTHLHLVNNFERPSVIPTAPGLSSYQNLH